MSELYNRPSMVQPLLWSVVAALMLAFSGIVLWREGFGVAAPWAFIALLMAGSEWRDYTLRRLCSTLLRLERAKRMLEEAK